ncbi:MAG: UDP-N-acetylglucosamine 1-carboxyvinyltransferase [Lentisphaeria bacterium]
MDFFEIKGGLPLKGTVTAAGNKNAVLPMIAAALLTDDKIYLSNVPDIGDVRTMLKIAESLGATTEYDPAANCLSIQASSVDQWVVPRKLCREVRAGILFAAPLLSRTGHAQMAPPGGDVIGRRRVDAHFAGLKTLGAEIAVDRDISFTCPSGFDGGPVFLPEASVTATEQTMLAAVSAKGRTVIRNAACEPHVDDLARLLGKMGAKIAGIGTNVLVIDGVEKLQGARHKVVSDHTEAGSFLALAAATGGEVTVTGVDPDHYRMMQIVYQNLGIELQFFEDSVTLPARQLRQIQPDPRGGIPSIDTGIWPQFPSDLMSVTIVLATQLTGTVMFFEKLYESRMYFVDRLIAMGANAVICDPHRVVVSGPAKLQGIQLSSPDIRAGIALLGAALCAEGTSVIRNIRLIDRGYENIEAKLCSLGARIERRSMITDE